MLLRAADDGARSHAERLFIELVTRADITGWEANVPVGGYLVDFLFRGKKLAVEIDGWAFHSDAETFQRDRRRQNQLALLDLQILRFTWQDLVERPEHVIAALRRALSAR